MATRTFADLSSYRKAVDDSKKTSDLLNSIIGGLQQGVQLGQLPQTLENQQIATQLNNAINQQKLNQLQTGEVQNVGGRLVRVNPLTGVPEILLDAPKTVKDVFQVGDSLVRQNADTGAYESVFTSPKSLLPPKRNVGQEGDFIVTRDSQTGAEISREPVQKGRRLVDRGVLGAGFIDETTNKFTPVEGTIPPTKTSTRTMTGFDTVNGTFGIFSPDENGNFPEGIVPSSQAPKAAANKPLSTTQADQFTGLNLLDTRLDEIEKSPKSVRESNVGWIDNALGKLQSVTGVGDSAGKNDAFRTAVDSLVGEFSFGRGGKALTVNEKEILGRYLPSLSNSDATFESRIGSFRQLVNELRQARIQSLEDSGYNVDRFKARKGATPPPAAKEGLESAQQYYRDLIGRGMSKEAAVAEVNNRFK